MRTCQKYALSGCLLFCAGVLLLVPSLLQQMHPPAAATTPAAMARPVDPRVWRELDLARQLIQQELDANTGLATSSQSLRNDARQHFRQAIATLPASSRTLPALREIQAEAEEDFELLLVGNGTIRKLAAQQLLHGITQTERYIRGDAGG